MGGRLPRTTAPGRTTEALTAPALRPGKLSFSLAKHSDEMLTRDYRELPRPLGLPSGLDPDKIAKNGNL